MIRTRSLIAALFFVAAGAFPHSATAAKRYERLFWIERSTNANIVAYDAVLEGDRIDASSPIVGYWVNKATNGATESLSALDKMAYGYSVKRDHGDAFLLTLKAAQNRTIRVVNTNGKWVAQVAVTGRPARLTKIYVSVDSSGILPSAKYVEVYGVDWENGQPLKERLLR